MKRIYDSYDDIDIPKDNNGNYIVDDPDIFDSVYITRIFDRYHPDKVKFIKEKRVFTNLMVYTFKCKSCGKTQTRSFRTANIDNHKTLLCQDCLNIERYGYAHTYDNKEKQRYALDKILEKHGGFGMANKEIRDKIESTNLEKFGSKCSLKDPEVNAKARKTTKEKYGVEYALQCKDIYDETVETLKKKYGVEHALQNDNIRNKMREKIIEKYGVSNTMQIPEIQEKSMQNRKQHYLRDGISFDSKWELAYWIYVTECLHGDIKRCDICFKYSVDNITHKYYPDFIYNGKILEMKGDHFYKDRNRENEAINPFDRSKDKQFEAKRKCAIENGVEFISIEEIEKALNFVKEKYGNGYLDIWCVDEKSFPYPKPNKSFYNVDDELIKKHHKSIYKARTRGCKYSPYEAWFNKDLIKELVDNRLKYSDYNDKLSPNSILQGFSVTRKAKKVSVFKPKLAKELISKYLSDAKCIFDPFSGFSGRMIGAIRNNIPYIGQDINSEHIFESIGIYNELCLLDNRIYNVSLNVKDIFDSTGEYDCLFTCSPYADKEDWGNINQKILSCDEWIDECLKRFRCRKYLFVVDNTEKYKDYVVDVIENKSHFGINYERIIFIDNTSDFKNYRQSFYISLLPNIYYTHQIYDNGITPFDITSDKYVDVGGKGLTPFDI